MVIFTLRETDIIQIKKKKKKQVNIQVVEKNVDWMRRPGGSRRGVRRKTWLNGELELQPLGSPKRQGYLSTTIKSACYMSMIRIKEDNLPRGRTSKS